MTTPTARLDALVGGPSMWHDVAHLGTTTSTNDVAAARIAEGSPAGVVVVADAQTAGRGRQGRAWEDRPGGSLLFSVTVPTPPTSLSLVPLATGVAVVDALLRRRLRGELKWPNDVLVGGRKCAGILVEHHGDQLVIGVGINVDWRGIERDGEMATWTSVAEELDADVDRWDLLTDVLRGLDLWVRDLSRGVSRLLENYTGRCITLGRQVRVATPGGTTVEGTARDISRDGELVIESGDGLVAVRAGDVEHVRPAS